MLGTHLSFSLAFLPGLSCPLILFSLIFLFSFTIVIVLFFFEMELVLFFLPIFFYFFPHLMVSMLVLPSFVPSS